MAIEKSVSNYFCVTFVDSINVFDCRIPGVENKQDEPGDIDHLLFLVTSTKWKTWNLSTNVDQKWLETESLIAIYRPIGDKWQSKHYFSDFCDPRSSIVRNVFDCRLSGVTSVQQDVNLKKKYFCNFPVPNCSKKTTIKENGEEFVSHAWWDSVNIKGMLSV